MSDDRKAPPSPRRLRKTRSEGRIAFSPEPAAALALAIFVLALPAFEPGARCQRLLRELLDPGRPPAAAEALAHAGLTFSTLVLPWLLMLALLGVGIGLFQTRGLFTLRPLQPKLERLSPAAGMRRLFSLDRLVPALRGFLLTLVGLPLLAWWGVTIAPDLIRLLDLPSLPSCSASLGLLPARLLTRVLEIGLGLVSVSAVIDLLWRRHRHHRSLFTTAAQRREEHRREEGDPRHRQQRKKVHRQLASSSPPPVREAKVLLLNPTRLAVALHHDALEALPYLGMTATGLPAARLRAQARRAGVPLLRDRALTRALFALEAGDEIPTALYAPVAAVLASLYRAGLATPPPEARPTLRPRRDPP